MIKDDYTKFLFKQIEDKFDLMESFSELIGKNKYKRNPRRQMHDIQYFMRDAHMLESYFRALRDKLNEPTIL